MRPFWKLTCSLILGTAVLAACGDVDEETVVDAQQQSDTTVVVDEPAAPPATSDDEPNALALRDDAAAPAEPADADVRDDASAIAEPAATTPNVAALPPIDQLDEGLADFASCLNDNGVDVASFTLQDMVTKAAGMPIAETRAELFAFFLDADGTDPRFVAAVEVCNPIVDAIPGLGAFLPGS